MPQNSSTVKHRARTVQDRTVITEEARRFITNHTSDPSLCIDDVADAVGVPVRTLQRALASCDTDYSREVANTRLMLALRVLSNDNIVNTVSAAARWCGYQTPSHFTKAFRERYGVTPSLFRRVAKIENRLIWRRFNDKVRPVKTGSSEYFRRRKRYNEDARKLRVVVAAMPPAAKEALQQVRRPERFVLEREEWRPEPAPAAARELTDEQFNAMFERRLFSLEELHPYVESPLRHFDDFDSLLDDF
jgi:AraC-like DNA-binding protein